MTHWNQCIIQREEPSPERLNDSGVRGKNKRFPPKDPALVEIGASRPSENPV